MPGWPPPPRGRRAFAALTQAPRRVQRPPVAVHFLPEEGAPGQVRVAYAIGRKLGGAVVRNRCRRRLRAIVAELAAELPPGSYLIRVGPGATALPFEELRERVSETMREVGRQGPGVRAERRPGAAGEPMVHRTGRSR